MSFHFAISGPPTNKGNKKFPNPPIIEGITIKKIITMACAVIILLYNWLSAMYCTPGPDSSNLIKTEKAVPIKPENKAKIRYKVPMSLALEDPHHLFNLSVHFLLQVLNLSVISFLLAVKLAIFLFVLINVLLLIF